MMRCPHCLWSRTCTLVTAPSARQCGSPTGAATAARPYGVGALRCRHYTRHNDVAGARLELLRHLVTHDRHACEFDADTLPHVPIGSQLPAHTHSHVDTRPALGAGAWPLDFFTQ